VIQELADHHFYLAIAKESASSFVKDLLTRIAGDEMRHHVFYRDALRTGDASSRQPSGELLDQLLSCRSTSSAERVLADPYTRVSFQPPRRNSATPIAANAEKHTARVTNTPLGPRLVW
jgi:hypothetical protein